MKVLVTGANGQLGTDLCQSLQHFQLIPLTHSDIEITNMNSVKQVFGKYKPDTIINTAAYVRVDDCETEQDKAFQVNALGARNAAVAAQELGAKLIHISTDYVFGGEAEPRTIPYTEFDTPVPISIYGKSKLAGEDFVRHLCQKHFIIRSSGLFGAAGASGKGGNFVETILKLAQERHQLKVVNNQIFSPTYSKDLATKITQLITTEYYGIFHITNRGSCSWYEFAKEILKQAGLKTPIIPITSDQYLQKAKRPSFSVLDNYHLRLLGLDDMRPWQEALKDYMISKGYIK
ncbi:MAG: dTDP-4-dehydrorhamnose reductase [Chloroflexi bacterium CG_4_9_14_3_um_filter_45_9]|nr:MAG: dTDP-4-dehydrorhamnose reductase [Dehalococcoidia bacterium CG2_30_46_9]PIU23091.1 MAG: dTDP-4-dehydrorhamnose reductase [Chloroflexi bacterium CG08_land_8_20_14_0_20_45_12]PIX27212.1 MAG: dTDP-4-dehydrorhamnose reductase [Chloroflexi bacterium CG_4_8_14_3_um_filter_45_15]PJB50917.1 MAG: dTDP-4-dehydrorhamnose reductase [Chloroflexi bacterium CG_4_9_14_3_um_filter_45_9]